ncbi:hypothetical protein EON65_11995 [archaeon]|nr:MAG: hypothetical protein EON65_11995 [archaeon]
MCWHIYVQGLFSKRRQLILTDAPRLIYVDPTSMELKGEIPWTRAQPVSCIIVSSYFSAITLCLELWIELFWRDGLMTITTYNVLCLFFVEKYQRV